MPVYISNKTNYNNKKKYWKIIIIIIIIIIINLSVATPIQYCLPQ